MKIIIGTAVLSFWCAGMCFGVTDPVTDFKGEMSRVGRDCDSFSFNGIAGCADLLFTDHPLHIAIGSLAPGNSFGAGVAAVGHWETAKWINTWDVDAIVSPNLSWRAGGYMTFVWANVTPPTPHKGRPKPKRNSQIDLMQEQPVFHLYAETDSLNKLTFFGIGPSTAETGRTYFGMRETVTGGNVVLPLTRLSAIKPLRASILAEANGRFVSTRNEDGQGSPSIEQVYSPLTAPGLFVDRSFAQFGEGVRLDPSFASDHVQLDYLVNYQEYLGQETYSFRRFTTDLSHTFQIYQNHLPPAHQPINGPDECFASKTQDDKTSGLACPDATRDYEGSLQLRFLLSESFIPAAHIEPFYFQPTLGGTDINGNPMLSSFQDYRFRAPNLMVFRAAFEHSIYKWPVGLLLMLDEGKVALNRSDIDLAHLQHSYSAGLTLHAGGFPVLRLLFSWGGHEGTHTTAAADTSLLGGGARPSLY
jgi:hypothetical protein